MLRRTNLQTQRVERVVGSYYNVQATSLERYADRAPTQFPQEPNDETAFVDLVNFHHQKLTTGTINLDSARPDTIK